MTITITCDMLYSVLLKENKVMIFSTILSCIPIYLTKKSKRSKYLAVLFLCSDLVCTQCMQNKLYLDTLCEACRSNASPDDSVHLLLRSQRILNLVNELLNSTIEKLESQLPADDICEAEGLANLYHEQLQKFYRSN